MITIKNYISMIYDDFREYIDQTIKMKIEESKRLITSSNIRMRLLNY